MKVKRLSAIFSATVLMMSSLIGMGFAPLASAVVNSCTWTGATNNNFNTANNWSNCNSTAPQNGDNLIFDVTTLSANKVLNNDISSLSIGNITFQGTNSSFYSFALTGTAFTVTGNITDSTQDGNSIGADITLGANLSITTDLSFYVADGHQTIHMNGHDIVVGSDGNAQFDEITGSGNITASNGGTINFGYSDNDNSGWTGSLSLTGSGSSASLYTGSVPSANAISVADGSELVMCGFNGASEGNALTIGGRGIGYEGTYFGALYTTPTCNAGGGDTSFNSNASVNWTGPVTLSANTTIGGVGEFKVTGALHGSYTLLQAPGTSGKVTVASSDNQSQTANGTQSAEALTVTYSNNQPTTPVSASANNIAVVDGTYGDASVTNGGTIKGTGSVNSLDAENGAIVAPGHSPGKLTVRTTLTLGGGSTYQAELKDTADGDFDQIVVGSASDTTGNDIILGVANDNPALSVSLYDGFKIASGDTFKIIDNLSQTPVSGTFASLPEGATFQVGDGVFKISYVGGDGNDVVLTVVTAPTTPDTGFAMIAAHPGTTLGITILAAGIIFGIAQRTRRVPVRAKASPRRR